MNLKALYSLKKDLLNEESDKKEITAKVESVYFNYDFFITKYLKNNIKNIKKKFIELIDERLKEFKPNANIKPEVKSKVKEPINSSFYDSSEILNEESLKALDETVYNAINNIIKREVKKRRSPNTLMKLKRKVLEEDIFIINEIKKEINDDEKVLNLLNSLCGLDKIKQSIKGAINKYSGERFEEIVETQIKNKTNWPIKILQDKINIMCESVGINKDDIEIDTQKFKTQSADIRFINKSNKQLIFKLHLKFVLKETGTIMFGINALENKETIKDVKGILKNIFGDEADKYTVEFKTGKTSLEMSKVLDDLSSGEILKNKDDILSLLRFGTNDFYMIKGGDKLQFFKQFQTEVNSVEKNDDEILFKNSNGDWLVKIKEKRVTTKYDASS